jgi:CTP synthase (UTP-ammonia lyase)
MPHMKRLLLVRRIWSSASWPVLYNAYGRIQSVEQFRCSYGLAPGYQQEITAGALEVTAVGPDGEVRAIELREHPFFVATLFLPQLSSSGGQSPPLIVAFLSAAAELTKP